METHLSSDIRLTESLKEYHTSGGKGHWLPVHLILTEESLTLSEARRVNNIRYRWQSQEPRDPEMETSDVEPAFNHLKRWQRVSYKLIDRWIRPLNKWLSLAEPLGSGRKLKCRGQVADECFQFALFTSLAIPIPELALYCVGEDTIIIRLDLDDHLQTTECFTRYEVKNCVAEEALWRRFSRPLVSSNTNKSCECPKHGDGEEMNRGQSYIQLEFFIRDLLKDRPTFSETENVEKLKSSKRTGVDTTSTITKSSTLQTQNQDEEALAIQLLGTDRQTDFFQVTTQRQISNEIEKLLSRFSRDDKQSRHTGPLEEPSTVRGHAVTDKRGGFLQFEEQETTDDLTMIQPMARWASVQNEANLTRIHDLSRSKKVIVIWYAASNALDIRAACVPPTQTTVSDTIRKRNAILRDHTLWTSRLTALGRLVADELSRSLWETEGRLLQMTESVLVADVGWESLTDMLWISRDIWISQLTRHSCIIKALLRMTCTKTARDRQDGEEWVDIIDCARCRVEFGYPVIVKREASGLLSLEPNRLLRSDLDKHRVWSGRPVFVDDQKIVPWVGNDEKHPDCFCLLLTSSNLNAKWLLPGGFGLNLNLRRFQQLI